MIKNVCANSKGLVGEIVVPPDKSISHRAVMFASLANGVSRIDNFSSAQDPLSTVKIFQHLGVDIEFKDKNTLLIHSNGTLTKPNHNLDCGNSGTTMRLTAGILAGQNFNSVLIGDASLSKRPMKRIVEPLSLMGAEIVSENYCAPLKIFGKNLHSINYTSKIASAQVKSSVILAGLSAEGVTNYVEPYLSRNHSELLLKYMGADISVNECSVSVKKSQLEPKEISVCGDISSAAYFIVAALIVPNSNIILKNVGLNPTRCGIIEVVKQMGGQIEILDKKTVSGEIVGDIRVKYSDLKSCNISGDIIPRLIDEIPVIAVLATQAEGETIIKDAKDLRNKESDRISTVVCELRKLGADIDELEDGFVIRGKSKLRGSVAVETYNDHRLAMSLFVAGLVCEKEIAINNFEWVNISFPEFCILMNSLI